MEISYTQNLGRLRMIRKHITKILLIFSLFILIIASFTACDNSYKKKSSDVTVIMVSNGGTYFENITVKNETYVELPIKNEKVGYKFDGWYKESDFSGIRLKQIQALSPRFLNKEIKVYAKWVPLTNIEYKIKFYFQQSNKLNQYICDDNETIILKGKTESKVSYTYPCKYGYTFNKNKSKTFGFVKGDGSLELLLYYDIHQTEVSFDSLGGSQVQSLKIRKNSPIPTLQHSNKLGYTFAGWYFDKEYKKQFQQSKKFISDKSKLTVYAKWVANSNTKYTINFYYEKADNKYYKSQAETLNKTATTNSRVSFTPYPKQGYSINYIKSTLSGKVNGNGNLELNIYYDMLNCQVNFVSNGGSACSNIIVEYDTIVPKLPETIKVGYDFEGWYLDKQFEQKFSQGDLFLYSETQMYVYAKWIPRNDTNYNIEYYVQNESLIDFELYKEEQCTGTTDEIIFITEIENMDGFKISDETNLSGKIVGNGSLTIKIYFVRKTYHFTYEVENATMKKYSGSAIYGLHYNLEIPVRSDSTLAFKCWQTSEHKFETTGKWTYLDNNIILYPVWVPAFGVNNGEISLNKYGRNLIGVVSIPKVYNSKNITKIADYGFSDAKNITGIVIDKNIQTIGDYAFQNSNTLKNIYFKGLEEEWDEIEIGSFTSFPKKYFYSENEPSSLMGKYWHYEDGQVKIWNVETKVYFNVDGEIIDEWTVSLSTGSLLENPSQKGYMCDMSGYIVEQWYNNPKMTNKVDLPYSVPNLSMTYYGSWSYALVGEGFIDDFKYFQGGATKETALNIYNENKLIDFIEYIQFYNIEDDRFVNLKYLTFNTKDNIKQALLSAYYQCTYANWPLGYRIAEYAGENLGCIFANSKNRDIEASEKSVGGIYKQQNSFLYNEPKQIRNDNFEDFSIYHVNKTLAVDSSDQLVYALEHGYQPLPTMGSQAQKMFEKAKQIMREISDNSLSDIEILQRIYNWFIFNISYDHQAVADNNNKIIDADINQAWFLEGVFNNKKAVCDAIAKAFVVLARIEGIPAIRVVNNNHAWNKVYLDADNNGSYEWYGIDATWANKTKFYKNQYSEIASYDDFLFTDEMKLKFCTATRTHNNIKATNKVNAYEKFGFENENKKFDLVFESRNELQEMFEYCNNIYNSLLEKKIYSISFMFNYNPISANAIEEIKKASVGVEFNFCIISEDVYNGKECYIILFDA